VNPEPLGLSLLLTALALVTGALHVRAEYRGPRAQVYVFKPLTTSLIIALALLVPVHVGERYRLAVLAGLVCSLAGDVFLMLPKDRFLFGVASFLLAHLAYLVAFTADTPFGRAPLLLLPYGMLGISVLAMLWRGLGSMRGPVVVYVAAIVAMAWQAAARADALGTLGAQLAAVGAALFVVSDATLATDRFRQPFRAARAVILPTYYAAQILIAWSMRG